VARDPAEVRPRPRGRHCAPSRLWAARSTSASPCSSGCERSF
jgi:hypothetical protein